jgi:quercetin dioxygenase-like cupin family protein
MSTPEPLPNPQRVITDTDLETGVSHFDTRLDESLAVKQDLGGSLFRLGYVTDKTPNTLDGNDLTNYADYLENASVPPVTPPDGRGMMWYIDTPPGKASPFHRTTSFDVVLQISGEIEVTLESGEKRIQRPGDMLIQRATAHSWKNPSKDKWTRMVGVMYSSNPIVEVVVLIRPTRNSFS